ncbi:Lrp/AsnC family transcriptional regulator [Profundibacterium mesophilum]|uniref:Adenosylmethionine-8-amino-7-oxononanoate aminotransferase n=1 Tax=Profundibacterium mesophilum KAUST100406-0324 TaxID=1037889 RepID=A0A921TDL2_9RHOB|nr:Lrp/AsnC family transcriptional regulator [Profundibacterium mesophilum]KAF0676456.1 adenosylmethionine-8-amino-7-oxononanoate aminotransferase [Profundibacterium mesophilum KAUST100406-0324]
MGKSCVVSQIDETDRRLIAAIQKAGRATNAELGAMAGVSPSSCHRRIARLEAIGVIQGYAGVIDRRAVGLAATVFVEITLSTQADDVLDAFEREVARIPEVLECHLMAGTADFLLKVVAADTDDFARIHRANLARLPGVAQMQSSFALRSVRESLAVPL